MPVDEAERNRRRTLMWVHLDAENAHDLTAIMATFSPDAETFFNATAFRTLDAIAAAHAGFGFSGDSPGAIEGLRVFVDKEHFTDEDIVIEGRVEGKFARALGAVAPTNADLSLPFIGSYRFNAAGKLIRESTVMNLVDFGKTA
jgi:hypothetical protein